jgi:hypothetical protein
VALVVESKETFLSSRPIRHSISDRLIVTLSTEANSMMAAEANQLQILTTLVILFHFPFTNIPFIREITYFDQKTHVSLDIYTCRD